MAAIDPARRMARLGARQRLGWARAFREAVGYALDALPPERLSRLLAAGDESAVFKVLDDSALYLAAREREAFVEAGENTAAFLDKVLDAGLTKQAVEVGVRFDLTNQGAVDSIRDNKLRLIREFRQAQRDSVRSAMEPAIEEGLNPRVQATRFRDSVSLTRRQSAAVDKYRALLENRDPAAFSRALRDKRFDPSLTRAIRNKTDLTPKQIDRMVGRYRERYVKYRSEVIGRTEALRSVNQASSNMYDQAVENGDLNPEGVVRTWLSTGDDRTRDSHIAANGQRRALNEPFQMSSGALLQYPGDPSAPAAETILCRCTLTTRIEDLKPTKNPVPNRGVTSLPAPSLSTVAEFGLFRPRTGGGAEGLAERIAPFSLGAPNPVKAFRGLADYQGPDVLPKGVLDYRSEGHIGLNRKMRNRLPLYDREKEMVGALESRMRPTTSEYAVYRGERKLEPRHDALQVGKEYRFNQYTSTSTHPKVAASSNFFTDGGPLWQIKVPNGTRALVYNDNELEVLLGPNTKVRIIEIIDQDPNSSDALGIPNFLVTPGKIIIAEVVQ